MKSTIIANHKIKINLSRKTAKDFKIMKLTNEIRKEDIIKKLNDYENMKKNESKKTEEKVFEITEIIEEKNCKFSLSDLKKYEKFCIFGDYSLKNTFIKNFIDGILNGKEKNKLEICLIDSFLDEFYNIKELNNPKINLVYEEDAIEKLVEIYANRINEEQNHNESTLQSQKDIVIIIGDLSRMEKYQSILYLMNNLQNDSMMPKVYFAICSSSMYEIESYADSKKIPLVDLFNINAISLLKEDSENYSTEKLAI